MYSTSESVLLPVIEYENWRSSHRSYVEPQRKPVSRRQSFRGF